jgi:mono/diheme cytochrome c family protein
MSPWLALPLAALLPACFGEPTVGQSVPGGGPPALEPTFSSINAVIFTPRCATSACHGGNNGTPLSLAPEGAYASLVGAASEQAGDVVLVAPADPGDSYLVLKLKGTHTAAGGYGTIMPPDGDLLSDDEIGAIETWIRSGAPND